MSSHTGTQRTFSNAWSLGVVIVTLPFFIPASSLAQTHRNPTPPTRIRFTVGAISAQVRGTFTPENERPRYVIKARKGDHMSG